MTSPPPVPALSPRPYGRGVAWILAGALLWSTGGVGVKWLTGIEGWPPLLVSAFRSLLAAVVFFLALGGRWSPPASDSRRWFWLGALTYAYVVTAFVVATFLTTAANAIILQDTAPLWVLGFSGVMLGERARWRDAGALLTGLVGVGLCVWDGLRQPSGEGLLSARTAGDLLALTSGLAFGFTTIAMRHFSRGEDGIDRQAVSFLFMGNVLAGALGLGLAVLAGGTVPLTGAAGSGGLLVSLLVLAWLGFGQLGGGYLCVQRGLRNVPAIQGSLLMLAEPVVNPIWVALAVGEIPPATTIAGGALVLSGMLIGVTGRRAG
jgi:drug/metabolite transporter (DMT)-like permease